MSKHSNQNQGLNHTQSSNGYNPNEVFNNEQDRDTHYDEYNKLRNSNNKSSSKLPPSKKKKFDKYEDSESGWNNDTGDNGVNVNQNNNQNKYDNVDQEDDKENQGEQFVSKKPEVILIQCSTCGKNINQKALEKHVRICKYANNFTKNKKNVQNDDNVQSSDDYMKINEQNNRKTPNNKSNKSAPKDKNFI